MLDHSWFRNSCGRIGYAANQAIRIDTLKQQTARINSFHHPIGIFTIEILEIPPWDPILKSDNDSVGAKKYRHVIHNRGYLMGFKCQENHVHWSKFPYKFSSGQILSYKFIVLLDQLHPSGFYSSQMRTTCYYRNIMSRICNANSHVTTDGSGSNNTYLHAVNSL